MKGSPSAAAGVELSAVSIHFGDVAAVRHATLAIAGGEFFTLLGPSGCGKTTLLRAVAGFCRQSQGTIRIGGVAVDDLPAWHRDTGMVFQNYAIFPHLDVWHNVAYGLAHRGVTGPEAERRVAETLAMVDLTGLEKRMPKQLSGGQQQRVVIARAVAVRPRVLLMDEPLANLDAKLRVRLRNDLRRLQRRLGITTIYVTHDQEEALCLSDRIAVMSGGAILQVGSPEEVYTRPAALRVAEFIGEGNFLRGRVQERGEVVLANGARLAAAGTGAELRGEVWAGFRPQDVSVRATAGGARAPDASRTAAADGAEGAVRTQHALRGVIRSRTYFGSQVRHDVDCGLDRLVCAQVSASGMAGALGEGASVELAVDPSRVMLFPGQDAEADL
ncbi:MAG: ABC transporter ATP-binding protein [Burkholderiales bacterium]|nr:ABC transporter ATP-binding protein [Burkholderiales bacterium]